MADIITTKGGDKSVSFAKVVEFKPKNRKFRQRKEPSTSSSSSDSEKSDENDEELKMKLEEAKILRNLRRRPNGVSATGLALGKKMTAAEEMIAGDPFKLKSGGIVNMKALKSGKVTDSDGMAIGTAFSAETNQRDEDADMMKYIEEELGKRKKTVTDGKTDKIRTNSQGDGEDNSESQSSDWIKSPEDALYEVPEHLRVSSSKKSEEMLSNQMLSGIPEVDLGIEAKIKNIEATEEAKQKLVREKMSKKDTPSQFVPTNMAVNFVQHNRFNIEEEAPKPKRLRIIKEIRPIPVVGGDSETGGVIFRQEEKKPPRNRDEEEKATDDFHFEKFKKQFRRY